MDQTELNKLLEELGKAKNFGIESEAYQKSLKRLNTATQQIIKDFDAAKKLSADYNKAVQNAKAGLISSEEKNRTWSNRLKESVKVINDNIDALEEERQSLLKTGNLRDATEKLKQIEEKKSLAAEQAKKAAVEESTAELKNFGKTITNITVGAVGGLARNLTSNAGAIETGGAIMNAAIDGAAAAGSSAGKSIGAFGQAAMQSGGKLRTVGIAATLAGGALESLADNGAKAAKFAVEILGKQLGQLRDGFQAGSKSGAVFADGMTGMKNAAGEAGLTVQQFGKVVSENAKSLGASGMGMTAAAERMARIKGDIDKSGVGVRLQNLGYSFEEQAGLVSEVMGNLNRFGKGRSLSDKEIMQETEKYAKDLRLLSAVSGEEAKSKMQQARDAANNLAFQNKLAEMPAKQAEEIQRAMAAMSPMQQKAFMEMQLFGTAISKESAIMMSTNRGFSQSVSEFSDKANKGILTQEETLKIQANTKELTLKDRKNTKEIGLAGFAGKGGLEGLSASMNQTFAEAAKNLDPEQLAKQLATLGKAAETQDDLTKKFLASEKAYQDSMVGLQKMAIEHMDTYVSGLKGINEAISKQLNDSGSITNSLMSGIGDVITTVVGAMIPGLLSKIPSIFNKSGQGGPESLGPSGGGSSPAGDGGSGGLRQNKKGQWITDKGKFASKAQIAEHMAQSGGGKGLAGRIGGFLGNLGSRAAGLAGGLGTTLGTSVGAVGAGTLASSALAAGAAGYGAGTLLNEYTPIQDWLASGIDKITGIESKGKSLTEPTLAPATSLSSKATGLALAAGSDTSSGAVQKTSETTAKLAQDQLDSVRSGVDLNAQILAEIKNSNSIMKQMAANMA
jgi:hypothetical protein